MQPKKLGWHADVTYIDLPHRVETKHGPIAAVPNSDFTDNRVLRSSPRDLWDVYKGTFDHLYRTEPMSLLVLTLHCHFGGRPMITSVFEEVVRYVQQHPGRLVRPPRGARPLGAGGQTGRAYAIRAGSSDLDTGRGRA